MSTPKVSVILPNYNYARYLDERIQSILNQTCKDFELLILDDASTDNSREVVGRYARDGRVRTVFFDTNSGSTYRRWNEGAALAKGDYLWFAGADDSCQTTLLERLLEKLEAHPSVGLAFCQSWEIDGEGRRLRLVQDAASHLDERRWTKDFVCEGRQELEYLVYRNTISNASAVLLRRDLFFESGMFDASLKLAADWLLWAKMLSVSDVAYVSEPLNYFRSHPDTVRKTHAGGPREVLEVTCFIAKNYRVRGSIHKKSCDQRVDSWLRHLQSTGLKGKRREHLAMYRTLRSADPSINLRILCKAVEQQERLAELVRFVNWIERHPAYRLYQWLKRLGRALRPSL